MLLSWSRGPGDGSECLVRVFVPEPSFADRNDQCWRLGWEEIPASSYPVASK